MSLRTKKAPLSPMLLGTALIAGTAIVAVLIFYKDQLGIALSPTSTLKVHLSEEYGVTAYATPVKMAGIKVGEVTGVAKEPGGAVVTVEADTGVLEKLRSGPSARVRPTTLLGGNYFVDLVPGGAPGKSTGDIPREHTTVPVELDKITRVLQPDTLVSLQGTLRNLDGSLGTEGRGAVQDLIANAPATLEPAGPVLQAVRGTSPQTDLPGLVGGLQSTAAVLTANQGQLESIVADLGKTSTVLGERSADLSRTLAGLPATLDSANAGLGRLDVSLRKLRDTADPARPVARELNTALGHLDPVLAKAKPLVAGLNTVVADARPLVAELVPTVTGASAVLDDVRGPVLDRLNGPIKNTVLSPYRGTGHYQNSGSDRPFYRELAAALTGMDRLAQMTDANGATIGFGIGVGPGTLSGLPISLEQLLGHLTGISQKGNR